MKELRGEAAVRCMEAIEFNIDMREITFQKEAKTVLVKINELGKPLDVSMFVDFTTTSPYCKRLLMNLKRFGDPNTLKEEDLVYDFESEFDKPIIEPPVVQAATIKPEKKSMIPKLGFGGDDKKKESTANNTIIASPMLSEMESQSKSVDHTVKKKKKKKKKKSKKGKKGHAGCYL